MSNNITIIHFRAFDKEMYKNFYNNETIVQIHEKLKEICLTYVPIKTITAQVTENGLFNELNKYYQKDK